MKKSIKYYLLCFVSIFCLLLSSCGGSNSQTLEEYLGDHPTEMTAIDSMASNTDGLDISVKDNEVIYSFDIKVLDIEGLTEKIALSKETKESYDSILKDSSETYQELCTKLQDAYDIKEITCTVTYTYGDSTITSQTFSAEE